MLFKLHDRRADGRQRARGLSCDETGLRFGGDCALVAGDDAQGARVYRRRPKNWTDPVIRDYDTSSSRLDFEF